MSGIPTSIDLMTYKPSDGEISTLRRLAHKQAACAAHPINLERREQWKKLHNMEAERPLILCEFGWHEIQREYTCEHPLLRSWEEHFNYTTYRFENVGDDAIVPSEFPIPWRINKTDSHDGHDLPRKYSDGDSGGYAYVPIIKDIDSLADIVHSLPRESFKVDKEATEEALSLAARIFGDILPPKIHFVPGLYKWTLGLGYDAVHLLGYNEFIMALYDNPEGLHALFAFLRDEWMRILDFMEDENLLTADWASVNGLSDVIPPYPNDICVNKTIMLNTLWGFMECQEMVVASPDMFEEFIMPYVKPIADKFGYISYGCCEPLDDRLHIIEKYIGNLRKIGVTAWADQALYAGAGAGRRYVLSRRPNPALVCSRFVEDEIRADLRNTLNILGGCQLEFMMKDISTLQNEIWRMPRWVQIAREEIDRYYG